MGRKQDADEIRKNMLNNLSWRAAERNDHQVAQAIHAGEELDGVYGLNEAGLLDDFWHFLETVGIFPLVAEMETELIKRVMVPLTTIPCCTFSKFCLGLKR